MNRDEQWLLQEKYHGEKSEGFFADLERLAAGEPLAYLIGHIPFLDYTICLDSHPLIPRPETEFWVEQAREVIAKAAAASPRPLRVLDLCAGSGCIGVAIAKAIPNVLVDFSEIDQTHYHTINRTLRKNGIDENRVKVIIGDLFDAIDKQYDFILTNPPYIDPALDRAQSSVKDHEPHLALYGGAQGLECIARIIKEAATYLIPSGQLWLEHEPEQGAAISKLAQQNRLTCITHNDQYGIPRYSICTVAQ